MDAFQITPFDGEVARHFGTDGDTDGIERRGDLFGGYFVADHRVDFEDDPGYPLAVADGADRLDVSFAKSGLYDGGFVLAYRDRLVTAQFQHTAFLTESGADASGKLREVAGLLQHVEGFAPSAFIEQVLPFGLFVT